MGAWVCTTFAAAYSAVLKYLLDVAYRRHSDTGYYVARRVSKSTQSENMIDLGQYVELQLITLTLVCFAD